MLTSRVLHHLFLSASRTHEGRHLLTSIHLVLLHHREMSLRAGSLHGLMVCTGTREVLSLDVVNAICHDDRWLAVALFVHLGVSNQLGWIILEFEHGRPACFSVASWVGHRHVATAGNVHSALPGLFELLKVDVLKSLSTASATLSSSRHTGTHTCLQVPASLTIRRKPATSAHTRPAIH